MPGEPTSMESFPGHDMMVSVFRDNVALEVLKAVLANPQELLQYAHAQKGDALESVMARWSYVVADAMLAERSKKGA